MKKILILHCLLSFSVVLFAQKPNYEWAGALAGSDFDQGNSVIVDRSGNVYSTGMFSGKADFDPSLKSVNSLTSNGGTDIYISKLDPNGKFLWAVNMGSSLDDGGNSINLDASGNVYVTGFFSDSIDFDPGKGTVMLGSSGGYDIFVTKFDASGNFIWVSQMGGPGDDAGNGIDVDANGSVFTTGYFNDSCDFNPSPKARALITSLGASDIFISILDNRGNYYWAGQMGSSGDDVGNGIACDTIGHVFATGYFTGTADFNPDPKSSATLNSIGDLDIFVLKLNIKGDYQWAKNTGAGQTDEGKGIAVDGMGNNYSTGYFYGTADFDPGTGKGQVYNLTSKGNTDVYVWRLDASGNFVWARNMGGKYDDGGTSIALDGDKNVYTTGVYGDVGFFDPSSTSNTLTSNGAWDMFISRLTSAGNYDYALSVGNTDDEGGLGIAVDKLKSVYTTGAFVSSVVDFNPGSGKDTLISSGDYDAFVLKLSICKYSFTDVKATACNNYSYNGITYYKSGTYSSTLKNAIGCDSIITLNLTINTTSFGNLAATACSSYTVNGQTYTAEGTYQQTLVNKVGCDSFLNVDLKFLTSNGTLKYKTCNSASINGKTYTNSGTYSQVLKNKAGCDSNLTINLTIVKSSSSNLFVTACNSYKLFAITYTKSGVYNQTEKNNAGCDSLITLNLTINNPTTQTLNINECISYKLNSQTYTKSGTYTQVIPNIKGCDSTITLNLSINHSESTLNEKGCQSYSLNGKTYTDNGTYTQVIPNKKGCDSTITLNLTLTKIITTVTKTGLNLSADATGVSYQWVDCNKNDAPILGEIYQTYSPSATGDYAVKLTKDNCTDKSVCYNVKIGGVNRPLNNQVTIYPNPSQNQVTLSFMEPVKHAAIKLYNSNGQLVFEETEVFGKHYQLNMLQLSKGIYVVEISQESKVLRTKIVKN
jgi:hypothetical protein